MAKQRLYQAMVERGLVISRSQAESWIRLGKVLVDGRSITKPGYFVRDDATVELKATEQYVSRAGLKLASAAQALGLDFGGKVVLDVGSSTGGFTDYALQHGAQKVIAVDVGTNQLHPSMHGHPQIELHEQTDIRNVALVGGPQTGATVLLDAPPDIVVIDASFISLREILPFVLRLTGRQTLVAAMVKPQFEAGSAAKHKGVIKNDALRRSILKDFEVWARQDWIIRAKADSQVAGSKGNRERFCVLTPKVR